uniref:Uncharacterized protein n=1 Tax=Acrobeloides nanus TaxID=290746 RepID=A0A914DLP8_9BILA
IFLRADIDCEGIAKILVSQSPFGCVYTPVEECTDEDNENGVYGVLSMFNLRSNEVSSKLYRCFCDHM